MIDPQSCIRCNLAVKRLSFRSSGIPPCPSRPGIQIWSQPGRPPTGLGDDCGSSRIGLDTTQPTEYSTVVVHGTMLHLHHSPSLPRLVPWRRFFAWFEGAGCPSAAAVGWFGEPLAPAYARRRRQPSTTAPRASRSAVGLT